MVGESNAECCKERSSYYEGDHILEMESRGLLVKEIIVYAEHLEDEEMNE